MTIRRVFRTDRDLRSYELEDDIDGASITLEETSDSALVFRRAKSLTLSRKFIQELVPLFEHFAQYGNLPLPREDTKFLVGDMVTVAGKTGVFRIAKIYYGTEEGTGAAVLVTPDGELCPDIEEFRSLHRAS